MFDIFSIKKEPLFDSTHFFDKNFNKKNKIFSKNPNYTLSFKVENNEDFFYIQANLYDDCCTILSSVEVSQEIFQKTYECTFGKIDGCDFEILLDFEKNPPFCHETLQQALIQALTIISHESIKNKQKIIINIKNTQNDNFLNEIKSKIKQNFSADESFLQFLLSINAKEIFVENEPLCADFSPKIIKAINKKSFNLTFIFDGLYSKQNTIIVI